MVKHFFQLTSLNILSNITVPLTGLVDLIVLGHLPNTNALAGISLATILFDYLYWSLGFFRMGTTGQTAIAYGAGKIEECNFILYRSVLLALSLGLVILLISPIYKFLGFELLSGEQAVKIAGKEYFESRIWAAPVVLANFTIIGWLLGKGKSQYVLILTIVANITNILLDYVLVLKWNLAAQGAGVATACSQYVMFFLSFIFTHHRGRGNPIDWQKIFIWKKCLEILTFNRDIFLRTLSLLVAFGTFRNLSSVLGKTTLVSNAILLQFMLISAYLVDGTAFATESIAGNLKGSNNLRQMLSLRNLALQTGILFNTLFILLLLGFAQTFLSLIVSDENIILYSKEFLYWLAPVLISGTFAFIYDGIFAGLTEGKQLRNSMFFSTFLIFLPAALIGWYQKSNHILWFAMFLYMLARALSLHYYYHKLKLE
ncbi:MAG: MATE family efflux transporter [Spirochaetota bacterium]